MATAQRPVPYLGRSADVDSSWQIYLTRCCISTNEGIIEKGKKTRIETVTLVLVSIRRLYEILN